MSQSTLRDKWATNLSIVIEQVEDLAFLLPVEDREVVGMLIDQRVDCYELQSNVYAVLAYRDLTALLTDQYLTPLLKLELELTQQAQIWEQDQGTHYDDLEYDILYRA